MLRSMSCCWVIIITIIIIIITLTANVLMLWRCLVLSLSWTLLLWLLHATHTQGALLVQKRPIYMCDAVLHCTHWAFPESMHAAQHAALLGELLL